MSATDIEPRTRDPLTGQVHHHSTASRTAKALGLPCRTMCGIVKRQSPNAWDLTCCPMCADALRLDGRTCRAEDVR